MQSLTIQVPDAFAALRKAPAEFAQAVAVSGASGDVPEFGAVLGGNAELMIVALYLAYRLADHGMERVIAVC